MLKINDLNKTEATLYRSYVSSNKADINQSKQIKALCDQGQAGYNQIINIAQLLKDTAEVNGLTLKEATAKIRTQVSRVLNTLDTGLSLQGLGANQTVEIKAKAESNSDTEEGVLAEVREKPEASVNPATLSITHEQAWDFVEKYYTLDDVQALLGAVKSRIKSDEKQDAVVKAFKVA